MSAEQRGEKVIAFVLYPGLTLLDLVGPLQVLTALAETAPRYRTVVVAERLEPMDTDIPGTMSGGIGVHRCIDPGVGRSA
jgi:hypothetical protein